MTFATRTDEEFDRCLKELVEALPLTALQNIIERREQQHKPRAELRRRLGLLKALHIAGVQA